MIVTNPKIDGSVTSVPELIDAIPRKVSKTLTVRGTIPIPPWSGFTYHFQGIAPYNNRSEPQLGFGCISASSTEGSFSAFTQAPNENPVVRSVTIPNGNYYHAAGIQFLGNLLAVPLESRTGYLGTIVFYDISNPAAPRYLYSLATPTAKSSGIGITNYNNAAGQSRVFLVDYEYDHQQMYMWDCPLDTVSNGQSWTFLGTYTGNAFDTGDQYQCFALVTQSNENGDTIFLLGFREDEEVWLYTVDLAGLDFETIARYRDWNGSDFRNGTGLQIANTTKLRIWGTSTDPSGTPDNYHFNVYVYGA